MSWNVAMLQMQLHVSKRISLQLQLHSSKLSWLSLTAKQCITIQWDSWKLEDSIVTVQQMEKYQYFGADHHFLRSLCFSFWRDTFPWKKEKETLAWTTTALLWGKADFMSKFLEKCSTIISPSHFYFLNILQPAKDVDITNALFRFEWPVYRELRRTHD